MYSNIIRLHLIPGLGEVKLNELKTKQVQDYYTDKLEELSAQTVKHHHRLLSKALNDAVDWEIIEKNVAKKAKPPKPNKYRPTVYSEVELTRLFEAAKTSVIYFPIIFTAGQTGARKGELRALRWSDIDFDNRKLYINKTAYDVNGKVEIKDMTKNKRDRYVVMGRRLIVFLKSHRDRYKKMKRSLGETFNPLEMVFFNSNGDYIDPRKLCRVYKSAIKRAELKDGRFHDLRHSHCSIFLMKNVHPKGVSERMGHASIHITIEFTVTFCQPFKNKPSMCLMTMKVNLAPLRHPFGTQREIRGGT
jgi:integrase